MTSNHNIGKRRRGRRTDRRGVVGVLSMMFMVLFGSLAVAMAVVSQGNLQTAQTQLLVNNAIGATDTGLSVASARLQRAAVQFRIEKGEIDADYAEDLWDGTLDAADGEVLDADDNAQTDGIRAILVTMHAADTTVAITPSYTSQADWLVADPLVLDQVNGQATTATQITYIPLPAQGVIRAVVTGYSWDWVSQRWISRTSQQDFNVVKRIKHAILGSSRLMIGKNVQVNGPLGVRYTDVDFANGHPLVVLSDFSGLDPALDQKINDLYDAVLSDDTNGDNRLRSQHTIESAGLASLNTEDYDGDGDPDAAFSDSNGDGSVDEFDVFLDHYDIDGNGKVVLSSALTAGTPAELLSPEFGDIDENLAYLIDSAVPDRDGNGVVDHRDRSLGYRDGVIDYRDRYAKIRGPVALRVQRSTWEAADDGDGSTVDDYQDYVEGVIRTTDGDRPISFDVDDSELPEIETDTFDSASSDLAAAADGPSFATQAGVPGALWTPVLDANNIAVGQQFSASISTTTEATPYGSGAAADYYTRPVFENIVFKDVVIPRGLNALFINCTFAGVTRVENHLDNTHQSWQFYGVQLSDGALRYPPPPEDSEAQLDNDYFTIEIIQPGGFDIPRLVAPMPDGSFRPCVNTKLLSNNIRFHDCTFVGSIVADKPNNYTQVRNKLQFTGATRFYEKHPDRPEDPDYNPESSDLDEIEKSSMMLPHYSVDIGTNNASYAQDVNLRGLVIAGVLDVRGQATVDGALLLTFAPSTSDPALQHFGVAAGNPANFNTTLGYFGPDDGDQEGFNLSNLIDLDGDGTLDIGWDEDGDGVPDPDADPAISTAVSFNGFGRVVINWDPDIVMPDGLIAPIQIEPIASTYREGRLISADY